MNKTVLLLDEIRASGSATAYDIVEPLRPVWLVKRGAQSFFVDKNVIVYLDAARMSDRTALRDIPRDGRGVDAFPRREGRELPLWGGASVRGDRRVNRVSARDVIAVRMF